MVFSSSMDEIISRELKLSTKLSATGLRMVKLSATGLRLLGGCSSIVDVMYDSRSRSNSLILSLSVSAIPLIPSPLTFIVKSSASTSFSSFSFCRLLTTNSGRLAIECTEECPFPLEPPLEAVVVLDNKTTDSCELFLERLLLLNETLPLENPELRKEDLALEPSMIALSLFPVAPPGLKI